MDYYCHSFPRYRLCFVLSILSTWIWWMFLFKYARPKTRNVLLYCCHQISYGIFLLGLLGQSVFLHTVVNLRRCSRMHQRLYTYWNAVRWWFRKQFFCIKMVNASTGNILVHFMIIQLYVYNSLQKYFSGVWEYFLLLSFFCSIKQFHTL